MTTAIVIIVAILYYAFTVVQALFQTLDTYLHTYIHLTYINT